MVRTPVGTWLASSGGHTLASRSAAAPTTREDAADGDRDEGQACVPPARSRRSARPVRRGTSILRGAPVATIGRSSAVAAHAAGTAPCVSDPSAGSSAGTQTGRNTPWTAIASKARSRRPVARSRKSGATSPTTPPTEAEGQAEQVEGKIQNEWGEAKDDRPRRRRRRPLVRLTPFTASPVRSVGRGSSLRVSRRIGRTGVKSSASRTRVPTAAPVAPFGPYGFSAPR